MKLVCPHCAKVLEVAEGLTGQITKCGFCQGSFTVPDLQPDALPPLPPPPPVPEAPPPPAAPANPIDLGETLPHPGPAQPASSASPSGPTLSGSKTADKAKAAAAAVLKSISGVAQKQPGKVIFRFDPSWVSWVPPVCLIALFFLLFFTWISFDVGGEPLVSQSGAGLAFGTLSTTANLPGITGTLTSSSIAVYFLLTLVGFAASLGLVFLRFAPEQWQRNVGPWPEPLRQYKRPILLVTAAGGFLCILLQTLFAFPLQTDLTGAKAETVVATGLKLKLDGDFRLKPGVSDALAGGFLRTGTAWRLTQWLSLVAALAALSDWLLERKKLAGTPKLEIGWGLDS